MTGRWRSVALAVVVLACAGCGGVGSGGAGGPGTGGVSHRPSAGATRSASRAPGGTVPGAVPTASGSAPASGDDVSRALVATMEDNLGMPPSQAECVQRKIIGMLTAGDKAAVVAGWRAVVGTTPRPIVVPRTVINAARVTVAACAVVTGAPGQIHVTPVR